VATGSISNGILQEEAKFIDNMTNESISTSESCPLRHCVVYRPNFSHEDVPVLCPNFTSTVFFSTFEKKKNHCVRRSFYTRGLITPCEMRANPT